MEDPEDQAAFSAHWAKSLSDPANRNRTILFRGEVAGYVARFELLGRPSIAYWLGSEFWGRGVATEALRQFLQQLPERPLYARVACDNHGSIRVLEKTGFVREGKEKGYANARKREIEEWIFRLDRSEGPAGGLSQRKSARAPPGRPERLAGGRTRSEIRRTHGDRRASAGARGTRPPRRDRPGYPRPVA